MYALRLPRHYLCMLTVTRLWLGAYPLRVGGLYRHHSRYTLTGGLKSTTGYPESFLLVTFHRPGAIFYLSLSFRLRSVHAFAFFHLSISTLSKTH